MRRSSVRIKSEFGSFRDFVLDRENRRTIIMIIVTVLVLFFAKTAKDRFSGTRYIVSDGRTVAGVMRDDENMTVSFPLRIEAEKEGERHLKDVTLTISAAEESVDAAENKAGGTEESLLESEISELLSKLSVAKGKKIMFPLKLEDGTKLVWRKGQSGVELLLIFMAPLIIWFFYINGEKKKHDTVKAKADNVKRALPGFNDHLLLLLGSGLIFRDAFIMIAEGYRERGKKGYFEDQMIGILDEVKTGVSDIVNVITRKADELGVSEFSRLTGIIRDNQLKGVDISSKLKNESEILWDLRKKDAEERGRLAETKLTMPLAVLLMVLVLVTAAPAIIQVQGG